MSAAFYRHVDVRDRKFFSPHHGTSPKACQQRATKGNNLSLRDVLVLPRTDQAHLICPPRSSDWQASSPAPGNVRFGSKADIVIGTMSALPPKSRHKSLAYVVR